MANEKGRTTFHTTSAITKASIKIKQACGCYTYNLICPYLVIISKLICYISYENMFVCLMVLNATFNKISVISRGQFYWWRTDKLYHILLHTSCWSIFTTSVVISTDRIGSCKSNCHTITATTATCENLKLKMIRCSSL